MLSTYHQENLIKSINQYVNAYRIANTKNKTIEDKENAKWYLENKEGFEKDLYSIFLTIDLEALENLCPFLPNEGIWLNENGSACWESLNDSLKECYQSEDLEFSRLSGNLSQNLLIQYFNSAIKKYAKNCPENHKIKIEDLFILALSSIFYKFKFKKIIEQREQSILTMLCARKSALTDKKVKMSLSKNMIKLIGLSLFASKISEKEIMNAKDKPRSTCVIL